MAEVKGLSTQVTNLSESEAKHGERTNKLLTHIEKIEAQINPDEGAAGEDTGMHAKMAGGSLRSNSSEHPLLKVCHNNILLVMYVLKTSACGTHDHFSDVWSGGIWEQGQTYKGAMWGAATENRHAI